MKRQSMQTSLTILKTSLMTMISSEVPSSGACVPSWCGSPGRTIQMVLKNLRSQLETRRWLIRKGGFDHWYEAY
ncbi:Brevican Core Protein [Manis pentadactyla]|nr:Brevican Core Protein [Manis pentadactyla]